MRTNKREKNFHVYNIQLIVKQEIVFFFFKLYFVLIIELDLCCPLQCTGQDGALFLTVANFPWICSFGVPTRMLKLVFMLQLQSNLIILNVPIRIITAWHSFPSDMGAVLENS